MTQFFQVLKPALYGSVNDERFMMTQFFQVLKHIKPAEDWAVSFMMTQFFQVLKLTMIIPIIH